MSTYLILNLASAMIPMIAGFHKNIRFYQMALPVIAAIFISMLPFIAWDIYFTRQKYWGFNPMHLSGLDILSLPLEEWLFFISIPFASIFTHVTLTRLIPTLLLPVRFTRFLSLLILFGLLLLYYNHHEKSYTSAVAVTALIIITFTLLLQPRTLQSFYWTFLVILIPFFLVNGILTGTGIEEEIVWYNPEQILGIRIFTIPVEDVIYAFSLLLLNLFFVQLFKQYRHENLVSSPKIS